jgi:hypothetical protein
MYLFSLSLDYSRVGMDERVRQSVLDWRLREVTALRYLDLVRRWESYWRFMRDWKGMGWED